MQLTYYGHSAFSIRTAGKELLFDPFITPNEATRGLVDADALKPDYIFASHAHFDHVADVERIAKNSGALVIANFEIGNYFESRNGLQNVDRLNPGGACRYDFGRVKGTSAIHPSSFADGTYGGIAGGFLVQTDEGDFYYSGDTALTSDMKLITEEAKLAFAVLPIGDRFTMGPADALRASNLLHCNTVVGVHYNTWPPIEIDTAAAKELFREEGKTLLLPAIGETINL
jgi:L-ascorbate metabolism protein UlaG (beta-lactamase superfamily)